MNLALPVATETAAVTAKPQEPSAPATHGATVKEGFRSVLKAVGEDHEDHKEIGRKGGEHVKQDDPAGATMGPPVSLPPGNSAREALFGFALPRPQVIEEAGSEAAPAPTLSGQEGQPRVGAKGLVPARVSGSALLLPTSGSLTLLTRDLKGAKNGEPAAPQSRAPVAFAIRLSTAAAPGGGPTRPAVNSGMRTQQRARVNEPEVVKIMGSGAGEPAAEQTVENRSEEAQPQDKGPAGRLGGDILPQVAERAGMSRESTPPEEGASLPSERGSQPTGQTGAVHAPETSELKKVKPAQTEAAAGADSNSAAAADRHSPAPAPSASPTLNRMETMGPRPEERAPETSAQETREPNRVASPPEQTPAPAAREIAFRLAGPESSTVDVKLIDRAGKVHVAVRSGDGELAHTLRGDLPELIGRLEQRGFSAESWTPAERSNTAAHASGGARHDSPGNGSNSQESPGGQPGGDRGEGRRPPQRPRWMDELERNAAPEAGFREETQ